MRSSSDFFAAALQGSHQVSAQVDCFYDGNPILVDIPISTGSLEVDSSQLIPGSLSFTVPRYFTPADGVRRDLVPVGDLDAFACNGQRIHLDYTASLPGHGTETINLGWWRTSSWTEEGANLNVAATSLEAALDEYRFTSPIQLGAQPVTTAIRTLVAGVLPLSYGPGVGGTLAGRSAEDNRLEALAQLLTDLTPPCRMFVDDNAVLVVALAWDDATDPIVGALADGQAGTVVTSPTAGNRDGVYNAVVATGEADGDVAPVSAIEFLRTGPRAWNGPYGNVPYFYSSPLLTTVAMCRAAAQTRLANLQGQAAPVTIETVPDPRLEVGDVLQVDYHDDRRIVRIDALTLPLTAGDGAMSIRGHEIRRTSPL